MGRGLGKYGVPACLEDGRLNPEYRKSLHQATSHVHYEDNRLKGWQRRGISIDSYGQFLTLLAMAQYQCEICGRELTEKSAHLDHDHASGKVRGVLCQGCNHGVGKLQDSIEILRDAIKYLEQEKELA